MVREPGTEYFITCLVVPMASIQLYLTGFARSMQALVQEREKTPRLACRALRLVR